jgi:hypothetical protein
MLEAVKIDEFDLNLAAKLHIYLSWNHMIMWFFFLCAPIEYPYRKRDD